MKKKLLFIILGITVVIISAHQIKTRFIDDYEESIYKTYEDALNAGMIDKGWIPEFIPDTAENIHLKYDIDTNELLLTFSNEGPNFIEASGCIATEEKASHALNAKWWEDTFYDNPDTLFFQCDKDGWLAINGNNVWYWSGLEEIRIKNLTSRPKSYLRLDGKLVTLIGYVDFMNTFDTRAHDDSDTFALIPDFEKGGEDTIFVKFEHQEDAFTLLDEIHNETPRCTSTDIALQLALQGTLHSFEMPMNFSTSIGYELQLHNLDDVIFLADMGDPLPSSQAEFENRIKLELPEAKYPIKLASKGWVQLQDGFAVVPIAEDSASSLRVTLCDINVGDINGDDMLDAVALLVAEPGGSGTFYYLTLALGYEEGTLPVDTVFLGDRIMAGNPEIDNGEITLTYWTRPEEAPMSEEPSVQINARYKLEEQHLVEITP